MNLSETAQRRNFGATASKVRYEKKRLQAMHSPQGADEANSSNRRTELVAQSDPLPAGGGQRPQAALQFTWNATPT